LVPAGFNSSGINNVSTDPPIPDTEVQKTLRKGKTHVGGELEGIGRGEASGGEEDGGDLHGWRLDLEIVKANKRHCIDAKSSDNANSGSLCDCFNGCDCFWTDRRTDRAKERSIGC